MHYTLTPAAPAQIRRTSEKIYEYGVVAFNILINSALIRAAPGLRLHPLQVFWNMAFFTINTLLIDGECGGGIN